jgi:LPXTG-motif cell wall-anchored protein
MRVRTAFAVVILTGLASLGVPSAAADELPPTPSGTSAVTASADEPAPEPSDGPATTPGPEATPTEEPAGEESPPTADGAPDEPADDGPDPTPTDDSGVTAEEGELPGVAESATPAEVQPAATMEGSRLKSQAVAEPFLDPRASIGTLNCADLTIPVTLDNSRSTGAYGFVVTAFDDYFFDVWYYRQTFVVAAGATQVIQVPVADVQFVSIEVSAGASASLEVTCGDEPRASIGDTDCSTFTVPITLDNSRSPRETTFWVGEYGRSFEAFVVPAGAIQVPQVAVIEDSYALMIVSLTAFGYPGASLAAEDLRVHCVPPDGWATSTVEFDCNTRTILITIDNSDLASTTRLEVDIESSTYRYEFFDYYKSLDVAAGAIRVLRVPGPTSDQPVRVTVYDMRPAQTPTDDELLADLDLDINCPRTAARPTVAVKGAKLPQTGGFNLALPLLGAALLAGGAGMLALSCRRRH